MANPSAIVPGLTPGRIYTARYLLGLKDPLSAQIQEADEHSARGSFTGRHKNGAFFSSTDSSSDTSGASSRMQQHSLHSTIESVWGSASDVASVASGRRRRGMQERRVLSGEIAAYTLENEFRSGPAAKSKLHLYLQKQAVDPQTRPMAFSADVAASRSSSSKKGLSREEAIRQADADAAAAATAAAKPEPSSVSVSSTLVLNTKTKRLERLGEKEAALTRKRQDAQQRQQVGERTEKDAERLSLLWEAFHRGCTDTSGWLRTSDFAWALQRDARLFDIFGLKSSVKEEKKETGWKSWFAKVLRNRDDPLPLAPQSAQKMRAMLNEIRKVESHLIANERAVDDLKLTFETFAVAFAKFLGDADPSKWLSTEPSFVEIAAEKDNPYGMSMMEMLVRDSLLGVSLTKTEAWQPDGIQLGSVRLLELPGVSLRDAPRDRAEKQRAADAKFQAELVKHGVDTQLAARVRAEAERVELELLQKAVREQALGAALQHEEQQLQQRLQQLSVAETAAHLRPVPKFKDEDASASASAAAASGDAEEAATRKFVPGAFQVEAEAPQPSLDQTAGFASSYWDESEGSNGQVRHTKTHTHRPVVSSLQQRRQQQKKSVSLQQQREQQQQKSASLQQQQAQQEEEESVSSARSSAASVLLQTFAALRKTQQGGPQGPQPGSSNTLNSAVSLRGPPEVTA